MKIEKLFIGIFFVILSYQVPAQYTFFNPKGAFAIEVSLPNSDLKRLPINQNSMASLTTLGDYIIGGTAATEGLTPYIFVASVQERKVISMVDLSDIIENQRSVSSGFVKGNDGILYAGTIANQSSSNKGGHLLQISIGENSNIKIKDIGILIQGEGIRTITGNAAKTMLFGITYPSGKFFSYDIKKCKTKVYQDIVPTSENLRLLRDYALQPNDYLCGALITANDGMIYGSAPNNMLFYFNPETEKFTFFKDFIPKVWGRKPMGAIESWTKAADGKIYGGNAGDGQLFVINPSTNKIKNLGKPIMMNRLRGLTFGADGKLYGIAGAAPGYVHLFSYDNISGFIDLGNPEFVMKAPGIEQGINWRGFQLRTITSSGDGKYIIMGEGESLSQLMVFPTLKNK